MRAAAVGSVTTYVNDAAWNRTEVHSAGGISFFGWDARNLMTAAEPPAGIVTLTYNAARQRSSKESYDGSTSMYVYDLNNLLQETDGSGSLAGQYTNSTDEAYGNLLAEYDPAQASGHQEMYPEYDGQYSANALVDESGTVTGPLQYDAFG
jgi:YD repeat-containing protein